MSSVYTDQTPADSPSAGTVADKSSNCLTCGLIFDVEPIEIGRSTIDKTICIICEEHMATIEPRIETITKETYVLTYDRSELEAIIDNPNPWVRELRAVLNDSNAKPTKPAAAKQPKPGKVDQFKTYPCKICKRSFKKAGNLARHQADVHDNTTEIGTHKSESSD